MTAVLILAFMTPAPAALLAAGIAMHRHPTHGRHRAATVDDQIRLWIGRALDDQSWRDEYLAPARAAAADLIATTVAPHRTPAPAEAPGRLLYHLIPTPTGRCTGCGDPMPPGLPHHCARRAEIREAVSA